MRVLVTGATGFIGNHVIDCLLERGYNVVATSRSIDKAQTQKWYQKVDYLPYDLNEKNGDINLFEYFQKPDVLIHLAWTGLPNFTSIVHIEENLFQHYQFLKNYVEGGGKHLTCIGTCLEYGKTEGCLNEEMIPNPNCSYAIAKDSLRRFLEELRKEYSFTFQWVRLFYMYGEGQYEKAILPQLDSAIQRGEKVFNMSGGEQLRDYLHVKDVAQNICTIALQKQQLGIINCCSGSPISVRKLVEDYIKDKNYFINLNLGYYPYQNYEPLAFWGDVQKLIAIYNAKISK